MIGDEGSWEPSHRMDLEVSVCPEQPSSSQHRGAPLKEVMAGAEQSPLPVTTTQLSVWSQMGCAGTGPKDFHVYVCISVCMSMQAADCLLTSGAEGCFVTPVAQSFKLHQAATFI